MIQAGLGTILSLFGILLWFTAVAPYLALAYTRDISLRHVEGRSLGGHSWRGGCRGWYRLAG
jgi:hypothetical protein